jgi:hypothetical protein
MRLSGLSILLCSILLSACVVKKKLAENTHSNSMQAIETGFITIPDSVQTSIYWYWLSDNISKEGVVRDLEAMKKTGINRAFIGFIGQDDVPYGKVKFFSDEWWDILHTALKAATRLNIEIGIFNSPGWSQSGGPWVKPSQAMRYLTSSTLTVKGPLSLNRKLEQAEKEFQDVRVIAYPVKEDTTALHSAAITFKEKTTVDFTSASLYTVRSLIIYPQHRDMSVDGIIQVQTNDSFQTIKTFRADRSNSALNVGFKPYGPAYISIPATTGKRFRLILSPVSSECHIAEMKLAAAPVVENYIEKTLAKMHQTPLPYWDAYQWKPQPVVDDKSYVIDPEKVIDISSFLSADGTLKWNVPAGNWVIERCGMTPTNVTNSPAVPEATGLETDKMSKAHIEAHFNAFMGEILRRIPAEDRKTWRVTVQDSYETGGQNWTDHLIDSFKTTYGYDPTPYLPVMQGKVVGSEDASDRFLWDLRRFVADNVAYKYVAGLRDISHQHGLTTWLESYGHWGFPGEFLQYGGQSDEVGGEFWSEGILGDIENRAASSCAHIYGKTKVSAESFTGADAPFSRYPAMMKQRADRFFTEGINNSLLHVYIEQPYADKVPGINAFFGNEFNRFNTWFYDMDIFLKYLKRCNFLLQQGLYAADVAYFISEDAPKMTGTQNPALPKGYSFDYINAEVIKTRLSVQDGKLVLPDGMSYRVLVLPQLETIRPELLLKIKELVNQGAVVLGPKPLRSPSLQHYPAADDEVRKLADELWNGRIHQFGKGMVIDGMGLQEVFDMLKVIPDVSNTEALFIHRTLKDGDLYFLSNQHNQTVEINPTFRITGRNPELWDAVSGSVRDLPSFTQTATTTIVPLKLAPLESAFIIFRNNKQAVSGKSNYPVPAVINMNGPWQLTFGHSTVTFDTLQDWSLHPNDSIKYYSGAAYYQHHFNITALASKRIFLNLGDVKAIAKVKVNGVEVGGVWTSPYTVDITAAVKPGDNQLEVKVVNTWVNRLIGDSKLPVEQRKTWLNKNPYKPDSKLAPSGLLGPVKLELVDY